MARRFLRGSVRSKEQKARFRKAVQKKGKAAQRAQLRNTLKRFGAKKRKK